MAYDINGISVEVSDLDGIADPITLSDGIVAEHDLIVLKNDYFSGRISASAVRDYFIRNTTIETKSLVQVPANRVEQGLRPLFQLNPTRLGTGAQPFNFYFQNYADILGPAKFYWKSQRDSLTLAEARETRRVMLPVPPEKIEVSSANSLEEVVTAVGNTFLHSGPRPLETYQISGFFPHVNVTSDDINRFRPGARTTIPDYIPAAVLKEGLYQAKTLRNLFTMAMEAAQPIRFTISLPGQENSGHVICTRIVVISEFTWSYNHANGLDVDYSMTLKRWYPQVLGGYPKPPAPDPPNPTTPRQCKAGYELRTSTRRPPPKGWLFGDINGNRLPKNTYCAPKNWVDPTKPRPEDNPVGTKYTIKRGDTLWGIADRFLGSGTKWPKLHRFNLAVLNKALKQRGQKFPNPHLIYPGTVIRIPPKGN